MSDTRKVSFADEDAEAGRNDKENGVMDADTATDMELKRGKKTWSRKQFDRITKLFDQQPTRKEIFTEIHTNDYQFSTVDDEDTNESVTCAKIFNPAILDLTRGYWDNISKAQRLDVEDPEGILTEIPKHVVLDMDKFESFSMTWTKVKTLPSSIFHASMSSLVLPRNQIRTLNGIETAVHLKHLDLSHNFITALPAGLVQLRNLQVLNLSENAIKELPENIGMLRNLKTLVCSCNKFKTLPSSIGDLKELTLIDVGSNYLTHLPASIGQLSKLEDFRARSNQLSVLPAKFSELINLKSLLLGKNQFTAVPGELAWLANLQTLNMKDNLVLKMTSPIVSLRSLILDGNKFSVIEKNILDCSNLKMLWMQNNKIREIPEEIKNLRNLRQLHLSDNDISAVPISFREMDQLKHVSLRKTKIRTVPFVFFNMTNVTVDVDDGARVREDVIRKKGDRKTYFGAGLVSRMRDSIFAPDAQTVGASFGKKKDRKNVVSQYPASKISQTRLSDEFDDDEFDDDDDEFSVQNPVNKHSSMYPPDEKKHESFEMQKN